MTTMRDVAQVAGVSAKTVSRVFNDDPYVSDETRERVRRAMEKLHYIPNMLARSFRAGADATVGLAFPDIADPFFAAMTSSIEEDVVRRGMAVVITSLGHDVSRERAILETLLRRQISGLIIASISRNQSYLADWQHRTPMVFVDRAPRGLSAVSVLENDLSGAHQAVNHLAQYGHRRIAFLGISTYITTTHGRLVGYKTALRDADLEQNSDLICVGSDSPVEVAADVIKLLDGSEPPTAVFSATIPCTMALVLALQRAGRKDIGVVGFGDFPMADALQPAVTVIDQDPAGLGRIAVDRLIQRIERPDTPVRKKTVLPVRLIARGSGEMVPRFT